MKIARIKKTSFVDYGGKIATVIFTPGCNFDCFFCYNREILDYKEKYYDNEELLTFLEKRKGLIDAVVISGGEPTIQKGLEEYIDRIREKGYLIKLDTNGTNPDIVKRLINVKKIEYVAMDMKAPYDRYIEICCCEVDINKIKESVDILLNSNIDYEFRTTVIPQLTKEDIEKICKQIKGAKNYSLQQFKKPEIEGRVLDIRNLKKPHPKEFFEDAAKVALKYVENCTIKGF